ncbi:MAG TPA: serine/threonine-protein kinase [Verrucomicrobiota bacterium]|nr:hypothetical protein [Verrucomicrobiales bacterium]HRI14799.1 serine/threonine-protein kinase [Verrucomicrobiota bacterium]
MTPPNDSTRDDDAQTAMRQAIEEATRREGGTPSGNSGIGIRDDAPLIVIPDHQLVVCVGRGSYGQVWLARNVMGTYRAVKIVERASFQNARPFEREFNGILKFEPLSRAHPGLVDILQVGRTEHAFYYVMELADDVGTGQQIDPEHYTPKTLRTELDAHGHLPFERCLKLALALTEALGHLHAHGLIHRDIKPSNIIFIHDQPLLADIGLVAQASEAKSFVGTEGFIPPEGPGTVQADIYSLGKVLYELATGKDRHDFPQLPTLIGEGTTTDSGLLELNAVILKACQSDPKLRYRSAGEMRDDLLLLQSGKSVKRSQAVERRLARARKIAAVAVGLALVTVAAVLFFQRQARREATLRARAESGELAAQRNLYAADMNLAAQALKLNNLGKARRLLDRHLPVPGKKDLRGWEWRHLWKQCQGDELLTLNVMSNGVSLIRYSPDGRHLIAGDLDGNLVLWDMIERQPVGRTNSVRFFQSAADFSPDGAWFALGAYDGTNYLVRLWKVGAFRETAPLVVSTNQVEWLAFAPDGHRLFTVAAGTLQSWDVASRAELERQHLPTGMARGWFGAAQDFTLDRQILLLVQQGNLLLWDAHKRAPQASIAGPWVPGNYNPTTFGFSPDGHVLAVAQTGGVVSIWDSLNGRSITNLTGHGDKWTVALAFSPEGRRLVTSSYDQTLIVWDTTTWSALGTSHGHENEIWALAFAPDGQTVVSGSKDASVKVWSAFPRAADPDHLDFPPSVTGLVPTPDGRYIAAASERERWIIDSQTLREIRRWPIQTNRTALALSPDARWLAEASEGGTVTLTETETGQEKALPVGERALAQFSPDGQLLATVTETGIISIWQVSTGQLLRRLNADSLPPSCLCFSPDSSQLLISQGTGIKYSTTLWSVTTGEKNMELVGHKSAVDGAAFSRDGRHIATTSNDGTTRVWEAGSGREIALLRGQLSTAFSVAFSPDGTRLVTGTGDDIDYLYDIASEQELAALTSPLTGDKRGYFFLDDETIVGLCHFDSPNVQRILKWSAAPREAAPALAPNHKPSTQKW